MAGVYSDNQPDFSFLQPGETKTWSQFVYPIQKIGTVQKANTEAAMHLSLDGDIVLAGVAVSSPVSATLRLVRGKEVIFEKDAELSPGQPLVIEIPVKKRSRPLFT